MNQTTAFNSVQTIINIRGELVDLSYPLVMGILNITPDSFYDGGRYETEKSVIERCEKILQEGGKIIDIGAYSSRPGADDVPENEEWERVESALKIIRSRFPDVWLSLDTFRSGIVQRAVEEYGVDIINDIYGGNADSHMFETIGRLKVPYILMHMQGTPMTMQNNPEYMDVVADISLFFSEKVNELQSFGTNDIILDPGFGFGKTVEHNYELLKRLQEFGLHKLPLCVGVSRKSMIYKVLGVTPEESLNGTSALNTIALINGANILRVHDVKEAVEIVKLVNHL
ncbi:MAG: dihydropteroate synthase [Chlorobi bacterium]|nr:dihydropteroate synthase [Chlorobiota bacterium]